MGTLGRIYICPRYYVKSYITDRIKASSSCVEMEWDSVTFKLSVMMLICKMKEDA